MLTCTLLGAQRAPILPAAQVIAAIVPAAQETNSQLLKIQSGKVNWFLYRIFKTSSYIRSIQNGIFTVSEMLKSHNLLGFVPGPLPGC